jgi:4-oxalmesaconate hydratase
MERPLLNEYLLKNVFFDTCAYHQPGAELLAKAKPVENILFVSETIGAVQGIDPESDHLRNDTRRYIDAIEWLSPADRQRIYEDNACAVYRRLSRQLDLQFSAEGATI